MTDQVRPQVLSAETLARVIEQVDAGTAKLILEIIGRDRTLIGCACAPAADVVTNSH